MTRKPDESKAQAERLAMLPREDQQAVIAMYRALAKNPLATPACRASAKSHAAAVHRHLTRLNRRKES